MARTLNQKGIEKAAAKIYDKGITAATLGNCQVIAGLAIAAYLDEVEREAPASDPAPAGWREALTPSAETKAAYTGEFTFPFEIVGEDEDGFPEPHAISIPVPWTTIKEIMAAILARALYAAPEPPAPVQSDYAIEAAHKILGNRQRAAVPEPPVSAPGHTDLMVSPESIDAFLETNPLPPEPPAGDGWRDIASAPSAKPVLVAYKNRCDKWRVVKAVRYEQYQNEQPADDDEGECGEYCEEKDAYFVRAGWYELIDNWDDFGFVSIYEGEPVAWQHLPAAPKGRESE